MSHIIITGTGRTGTTFLVQLYTILGFDTGFSDIKENYHKNCNAGMEINPFGTKNLPHIIKYPGLCDRLGDFLEKGNKIEEVIVPIRKIDDVVRSRIKVQGNSIESVKGGLWETNIPNKQKEILLNKFYSLIYSITEYELNCTFIRFPEMINNPKYLYIKLFRKHMKYDNFKKGFDKIVNPKLVSHFKD